MNLSKPLNKHLEIKDAHATFSPSQPSWLNYDDDKLIARVQNLRRTALGTEIHEWSSIRIKSGSKVTSAEEVRKDVKTRLFEKYYDERLDEVSIYGVQLIDGLKYIPNEVFKTAVLFINDAIGFRMSSEQRLYYSEDFFGTSDALCMRDGLLRIHDLKTGAIPAHFEQLLIYDALYCLEYKVDPKTIDHELRIYQFGEVNILTPTAEELKSVIDKIVHANNVVTKIERDAV